MEMNPRVTMTEKKSPDVSFREIRFASIIYFRSSDDFSDIVI